MSGLREKQKAAREKRILQAAVTHFRARGYQAVRIEDLAEVAEVSVGTVYNYYRTKGDILIAVVAMEVEEVLAQGAAIVADPPEGVDIALLELIGCYYDHSLNYLSKDMWRQAMALAITASETPNGQRYAALDRALADQVTALLETLQARGDLRADIDPAPLGQLVFNMLNQLFIGFVTDETMRLPALQAAVADQVRPLSRLLSTEVP